MKIVETTKTALPELIKNYQSEGYHITTWEGMDKLPLKKHLLPFNEKLFEYIDGMPIAPPDDYLAHKRAIVGIPPCEARAALLAEQELTGDITDPYFAQKSDNTTLIVLPCDTPYDEFCFCEALGDSRQTVGTPHPHKIPPRPFAAIKEQGDTCLSCGICFMVCPTCVCFSVADTKDGRMRKWDGCMLKDFTTIAGGHTMTPTEIARSAHRWERKFEGERRLCVGCGRCERACPTSNGMRKLFEEAQHDNN